MRSRLARGLLAGSALVLAVAAFALSLHHSKSSSNIMDQSLHIALGRQGAEVVRQSPVPITQSGVDGLRMYDAGRRRKPIEPAVVLDDDYYPVTFPPVDHLAFYEEGATGAGIHSIAIDLLLPPMPKDPADTRALAAYDEAVRKIAQETIDRINVASWQRWIKFYNPRLAGRDTIAFVPAYRNRGYVADRQDMWGIDPSYRMTPEDWANLADTWLYWRWIKNGASITMRYERDSRHDRDSPYLFETLRVEIKSADATSGGFYGPSTGDRMKFKQSEALRLLSLRNEREAAAKAAGAKILEDWKDYPVGGVMLPEAGP
jgi:hypothetical protein